MCIKIEKKQHMWDKSEEIYIYIYISQKYNVCQSGNKTMVHEVRKDTSKPHYIAQSTLPLTSLTLC